MKDSEFIRGNTPMTKEEIRTLILSKLELKDNDCMMDIGAGTGSVSVEAALLLSKGKVISIEHKDDAIELINKNIAKHKVKNIQVMHTKAPVGMESLDCINKYYVGGSGGNLDEILNTIKQKAPLNSIIVVTAIIIDTMYKAYRFFKENNYEFELIQVSVNKIDPARDVAMMFAQNPIFIITAKSRV